MHVEEKIKLDLIKYNKSFQNQLNINLINYRELSGKYIIKQNNGIIKVYNSYNNNLMFRGDYNGKGKEYYDYYEIHGDNDLYDENQVYIKFVGEYLNGKRNGKGREFNKYGLLKFEGEYLNGKRNGKGKEYDNQNLIFEGIYLYGNKWSGKHYDDEGNTDFEIHNGKGYIKEYIVNNYEEIIFEGEYFNGKKNGHCKEYKEYNNKLIFEGDYLNGKKWNGKIYDIKNNEIYELKDGKGYIIEYDDNFDKILYKGNFLNGEKNGKGKEFYYNGSLKFEGEYLNGKKTGKGKEYYLNGNIIFEGDYLYNHKRKGKEYINGFLGFEGEYLNEKKWNGKGYDNKGNIIYELNEGTGKCTEYYYNGNIEFEGEYLNGKRKNGKEYNEYNYEKFEGEYLNGKIWNGNIDFVYDTCFEGKYFRGKKWNGKDVINPLNQIDNEYFN